QYVPIGLMVGGVLLAELFFLYASWQFSPQAEKNLASPYAGGTNTEALGLLLYTDYVFAFQVAGLILLVSMIGAIVLTLRARPGVRKQKAGDQFSRKVEDAMEIRKVASGSGL